MSQNSTGENFPALERKGVLPGPGESNPWPFGTRGSDKVPMPREVPGRSFPSPMPMLPWDVLELGLSGGSDLRMAQVADGGTIGYVGIPSPTGTGYVKCLAVGCATFAKLLLGRLSKATTRLLCTIFESRCLQNNACGSTIDECLPL